MNTEYGDDYFFFHVTPSFNFDSIRRDGLLLSKAANISNPRIWLVDRQSLLWGIVHVSNKYTVATRNLIVCEIASCVDFGTDGIMRHDKLMYKSNRVSIAVDSFYSVEHVLKGGNHETKRYATLRI